MEIRAIAAIFGALGAMLLAGAIAALAQGDASSVEWMAAVAAFAAVVQAVIAGVMIRGLRHAEVQAEAAMASVKIVQDNSERQLRAYINVIDVTLVGYSATSWGRVKVRFRNSGQTPAHNLTMAFCSHITVPAMLDQLSIGPVFQMTAPSYLGAGAEDYIQYTVGAAAVERNAEQLASGELVYAVVGRIDYVDVFGAARQTGFGVHRVMDAPDGQLYEGSDLGHTAGNFAT